MGRPRAHRAAMSSEHDRTLKAFGRALARARHERAWTQAELAEAMGLHSPETISRYERGEREPRLSTLVRMATVLKVTVASLVPAEAAAQGFQTPSSRYGEAQAPVEAHGYLAPPLDDRAWSVRGEVITHIDRLLLHKPEVIEGLLVGLRAVG